MSERAPYSSPLPVGQQLPPQAPAKKPWYKKTWVIVVAVILGLGFLGSLIEDEKKPEAAAQSAAVQQEVKQEPEAPQSEPAPAPVEVPQSEPAPESAPAEAEISDDQVRAEFQEFVNERANSGVMIAKAITSVTFSDGVVSVVFDPESIGMDRETFDYINAFPNLAKFIGTPMAFKDDQGNRLRTRVERIDTFDAAGNSLGSATKAEIYEMGTGEKLQ